jgi:hypothetical protein
MDKIIITRPMIGLTGMQVCVASDATDEEILEFCNKFNPSGTTNGWGKVERENPAPVHCMDNPERLHLIVFC